MVLFKVILMEVTELLIQEVAAAHHQHHRGEHLEEMVEQAVLVS
jgi:hypothetical protein